ncbi:MAG: amino acid racemase [Hyphomicrobiaceae bacterium]|nr:amino acid racemase [Hyphomicrobiaceae bacterium]
MTMRARPLQQPTIGILGGMSNEATGAYYQLVNQGLNARLGGWDNAEVVIVSVNFGNIEHFVRQSEWDMAAAYVADKLDRLERAGVDVIACVSNTMHRVVEPLMQTRRTPFIHIADPTGAAIRARGLTRVALLGTAPVMVSEGLAERYRTRFGFEVMAPSAEDRRLVDRVIFDELVRGKVQPDSKAAYLRIISGLKAQGAQGVILGCTEIFLLVSQADLGEFPVFDTTALHVGALVDFAAERIAAPA